MNVIFTAKVNKKNELSRINTKNFSVKFFFTRTYCAWNALFPDSRNAIKLLILRS